MKHNRLFTIVSSAAFCALIFVTTMIAVPVGIGNVNLGDGALLLCAWMLGGIWAALAAAAGAALADLALSYAVYAPATFVIKALMVLAVILSSKGLQKVGLSARLSRVVSAVCAEIVMVGGYFLYESCFLGYGLAAAASIPFNAVQGIVAIAIALTAYELLSKKFKL